MTLSRPSAILVTEDGRVFRGRSFGAVGETLGELVFSTGMSGYQETLTDPSYHHQIIVATAPHIGNTGWNEEDAESGKIWAAGYVVRDPAPRPSNWRASHSLDEELVTQGIVGICEIDTRALTRHIREHGALRAGISSIDTDVETLLAKVRDLAPMAGANLINDVTADEPYVVPAVGVKRLTVAALDLGIKATTPTELANRGIEVHVFPAESSFEDIAAIHPDGVFFSNGPGDPATATASVALLGQVLAAGLPYFGICFGNQILGRALGFGTYKLRFGHRGINLPVLERSSGKIEITSHNHGFAVDAPLDRAVETAYGTAEVSHICLNDNVVEGLQLVRDGRVVAFGVQYHPEAAAGPHDANYLFDRFIEIMSKDA